MRKSTYAVIFISVIAIVGGYGLWQKYGDLITVIIDLKDEVETVTAAAEVANESQKLYLDKSILKNVKKTEDENLILLTIQDREYGIEVEDDSLMDMFTMLQAESYYLYLNKNEPKADKRLSVNALCYQAATKTHCVAAMYKIKEDHENKHS